MDRCRTVLHGDLGDVVGGIDHEAMTVGRVDPNHGQLLSWVLFAVILVDIVSPVGSLVGTDCDLETLDGVTVLRQTKRELISLVEQAMAVRDVEKLLEV